MNRPKENPDYGGHDLCAINEEEGVAITRFWSDAGVTHMWKLRHRTGKNWGTLHTTYNTSDHVWGIIDHYNMRVVDEEKLPQRPYGAKTTPEEGHWLIPALLLAVLIILGLALLLA